MAKNIVIFADGTAKDGGRRENTNIYHGFNLIEDRTHRQISFYSRGVGTGWRKITGNAGGMGISANIRRAYSFILENFQADDSIFLIGFSRGAATVRSLSALIHHFGILPRARPELVRQAYAIYKTRDPDKLVEKAQDFVGRHHTMWTRIKFLGCYDTVSALGLTWHLPSRLLDRIPGFRHSFHDLGLSKAVEHAYHALAIDDERRAFDPDLWDADGLEDYQSLRQVWFTGMHSDVGGGYRERGLSDIALVWLMSQAVDHGLHIYPRHNVEIAENALDLMHDSRAKLWAKLYRRRVRSWDHSRPDTPIVHESVVERANAQPPAPGSRSTPQWILGIDHEIEPWRRHDPRSRDPEAAAPSTGEGERPALV